MVLTVQGGSNGSSTEEPSITSWQVRKCVRLFSPEVWDTKPLEDQKSKWQNCKTFYSPLTHSLCGISVTVRGSWTLSGGKVDTSVFETEAKKYTIKGFSFFAQVGTTRYIPCCIDRVTREMVCFPFSLYMAASGSCGEVGLWVAGADNCSYSEKVQRCLCFLYGTVWEQRMHMRKGEQLFHGALVRDF